MFRIGWILYVARPRSMFQWIRRKDHDSKTEINVPVDKEKRSRSGSSKVLLWKGDECFVLLLTAFETMRWSINNTTRRSNNNGSIRFRNYESLIRLVHNARTYFLLISYYIYLSTVVRQMLFNNSLLI